MRNILRPSVVLLAAVVVGVLSLMLASAEPISVSFQASLDGEQAAVGSEAVGNAEVSLDTESNVLSWNLLWSGFSTEVIAIHFHGPAGPGEDAFIQVELGFISGISSPSIGETTVSESQKAELLSELWYINIHTQNFVEGEIRGQVVRTEVPPTPEPTATPQRPLLGDVNCNDAVDSIDAALILQFDARLLGALGCELNADVNDDGSINSIDAALVLQFSAGLLDNLGSGPTQVPPATESPTPTFTPTPASSSPTPTAQPSSAPSGNDNFADAWQITSFPFRGEQDTVLATTEPGENLTPQGCDLGATVWFTFTPAVSGIISADTEGSDSSFDTVLVLYQGTELSSLTVLGCDDDGGTGLLSEKSFPVTAGTTYYIQAGGFGTPGDFGNLVLTVNLTVEFEPGAAIAISLEHLLLG